MQNRRLILLAALVSLFALGVIIWYMFFSSPTGAPSLGGTANPLPSSGIPARLGFIFNNTAPTTTTETEVTPPASVPFLEVWDKSSTGNAFVVKTVLKEITASSTSTTSPQVTKTIRATSTVLMFVDRATGYVYGHALESGATYQISNTTIPGVYDAYIFAGGSRVLMRYLSDDKKTITSILAVIPDVQEGRDPQPLTSVTSLQNNIRSVAVSDSANTLSYLVPNSVGASIYTITSKGVVRAADTPFSEWKLSYGGENLYATTFPSAYLEGITVSLPSFSRIVGGKTGLMSVPSSSGVFLNSMWSNGGLATFVSSKGNTSVLSTRTLAEKCRAVPGPQFICGVPKTLPGTTEGLPDDWYQGRFLFSDDLMVVSAAGDGYNLYTFPDKYGPMDVTQIETTPRGDILSFIRKNDATLWLLNTNLLN